MSLISIERAPAASGHINQDFERDSTAEYLALFDLSDDEMYVVANCGFGLFQTHPTDGLQRVTDIGATLQAANVTNPNNVNANCHLWRVTITYGAWNILTHASDGNPLNLPTRFRIDFTLADVAAFEDVDGNPIVNAAGDPYDPPLMREITRAQLIAMRNESPSAVDLATLAALSNALNEAAWNGFPAKTARLAPMKVPEIAYSQATNTFYFPMEYTFDINFDTWVVQVLNAGFRQLDASGNLVPILINGQQPTVPVPLDESGHAILTPTFVDSSGDTPPDSNPEGESGEVDGGGEPPSGGTGVSASSNLVVNAYNMKRTADFGRLNMDNLFTLPVLT